MLVFVAFAGPGSPRSICVQMTSSTSSLVFVGREYGAQGTPESFQVRPSALGLSVCLCFWTEPLA